MDGISFGQLVNDTSAYALLVAFAIAMLTDKVVSGKRLREERQEKREALDIVKGYGATLEKLLAGTETIEQMLRSLPHPSDKERTP